MKKPNSKLLFDTPGWTIPKENVNPDKKTKRKKKQPNASTEQPSQPEQQKEDSPNPKKRVKNSHPPAKKHQPNEQTETRPCATINGAATHQLAHGLLNSGLNGSRFRILNETLYTSTGPEALKLFQSTPSLEKEEQEGGGSREENPNFEIYHLGFRSQTKHWPQNPVHLIAHDLQHDPHLLKNHAPVLVADLGCGEAPLAKLLCPSSSSASSNSSKKKANASSLTRQNQFKVFSYDLVADPEGWITVAECSTLVKLAQSSKTTTNKRKKEGCKLILDAWDVTKLQVPLPGSLDDRIGNGMMDVGVCCLSLMSTNWVGMIFEARRILKQDGELRIAEVTSRFVDVDLFVTFIKSLGFSNLSQDQSNTHFILFKFKKAALANSEKDLSSVNLLSPKTKLELIETGRKLLKPCIYKRR